MDRVPQLGLGRNQSIHTISDLSMYKTDYQRQLTAPIKTVKQAIDTKTTCCHKLLWLTIIVGSTALAVYSSTTIYMSWQEYPVMTTFGSDLFPINNLEFPSIILCSPGNNMASLANVSYLLKDDWIKYWSEKNVSVIRNFDSMSLAEQKTLITMFVMHHIPGWPLELSLESFLLHMTTHFPALRRTLLLWAKEAEYENMSTPVFDILLNPARSKEMRLELEKIDKQAYDLFKNMDFSDMHNQKIMLSVLWFTAQPCRQLFTLCFWKGQRIGCEKIFFAIPTDMGFCCAFNHNSLSTMLRGKRLAGIIEGIESKYDEITVEQFNNAKSVANDFSGENFGMEEKESGIDYSPNWGIQNGLTVVMDTMSDFNPASVRQDFQGVTAAIKGKNQFPIVSRDSFLIQPGHETYIAITATHTTALDKLRSLPISARKCFYQDEFELSLFKSYSVKNCWMESLTNYSRKMNNNGCVPWNFPSSDDNMPPCRPMERHRFLQAFRNAETNKFVASGLSKCLPDCGGTSFDISVTMAPLRKCDQANMGLTRLCDLDVNIKPQKWSDSILESYTHLGNGTLPDYITTAIKSKFRLVPKDKLFGGYNPVGLEYNAFDKDISIATFYFPRHTALELVKTPKMSIIDFLSQVGGILGLCVGISLISAMEFLYWMSIKVSRKLQEMFKQRMSTSPISSFF